MNETIKITKRFYEDHKWRDLPTPAIVRETSRHFFIDATDIVKLDELFNDAQYHSDYTMVAEVGDRAHIGVVTSAIATARALRKFAEESSGHWILEGAIGKYGIKFADHIAVKGETAAQIRRRVERCG